MITKWIAANWDIVLKAAGTIGGLIATIGGLIATFNELKGKIPESRSQLKLDLEILQLLTEKDDPSHILIKDSIDAKVEKIYSDVASKNAMAAIKLEEQSLNWFQRIKWKQFIYGLALLGVLGPWTFSLYNRGSWWALLTGFFALGGIGNVIMGLNLRTSDTSGSTTDPTSGDKSKEDGE